MNEKKSADEVLPKHGFLEKKGVGKLGVGTGWKRRYFRLRTNELDYFENEEQSQPTGSIHLKHITKISLAGANLDLQDQSGRLWQLHASSEPDAESWHEAIRLRVMGTVVYEGWMAKQGELNRSWKDRWFVLRHMKTLDYFEDKEMQLPKGKIDLTTVLLIGPGTKDQYGRDFTIQALTRRRNWVFTCKDEEEVFVWISHLERSIPGARRLITIKEGSLEKSGELVTALKTRWFALCSGWLFYFESEDQCSKFKSMIFFDESMFVRAFSLCVKGSIDLRGAVVKRVTRTEVNKAVGLDISTVPRTFKLTASSEEERDSWFQALAPICNNQELSCSEEKGDLSRQNSAVSLLLVDEDDDEKLDFPISSFIEMMDGKQPSIRSLDAMTLSNKESVNTSEIMMVSK